MKYKNNPISDIKKEGKLFVLTALLSVAKLENEIDSLNPKDLVYNIFGKIEKKELSADEEELQIDNEVTKNKILFGDEFVLEYKSLCGHLLQKKYVFDDYLQGGLSLLNKNKLLKEINAAPSAEDISEILFKEYEKEYHEKHYLEKSVRKSKYLALKISVVLVSLLLAGACTYIVYNYVRETKIDKAYIAGHEAYLVRDYPKCLNSLASVKIEDIDAATKMILAVSAVKTDNLTQEQKDNITFDITSADTEIIYDYWIKLNRNMYQEAETVAKQLSDDELLLYAYMKESLYLKNNTSVEGEEKAARLTTLQSEIEKLGKVYDVGDEQEKNNKSTSILR